MAEEPELKPDDDDLPPDDAITPPDDDAPEPSDQPDPMVERLQGLGISTEGFDDVDSALKAYADKARQADEFSRQLPELQQYAYFGQQLMPHAAEFQEFMRQKQAAEEPKEEAKPYWDKAPEWNREWEKMLTLDETGQVVPRNPQITSPDIVQRYHDYLNWKQQTEQKLFTDPVGAIYDEVRRRLSEDFDNRYVTQEGQRVNQDQQFVNAFETAHANWMFAADESGQPLVSQDGRRLLSDAGNVFRQHINMLATAGVSDPAMQAQLAIRMMGGLPQAEQETETPAEKGKKKKDLFRDRALHARAPNRDGTLHSGPNAPSQNPDANVRELFDEVLRQKGYTVSEGED